MTPKLSEQDNGIDLSLIRACQRGERAAFHDLFLRFRDPVFRLAFRFTAQEADAEDLAQEIFLRVFERIGTFRCESSFSTWLYRLAVNQCLNYRRRPCRVEFREAVPEEPSRCSGDPLERSVQREQQDRIHQAVADLPEGLKAVFILVALEEHTYAEAAETLDLTVEAVRMRMSRARRELRERLKEGEMR
jgi:RNA polymerase sigma-70 factor (ECF subfamily)